METEGEKPREGRSDRRSFLATSVMASGLVTGYGACGAIGATFLFPAHDRVRKWLFVARVDELRPGESARYTSPTGERIAVARQGTTGAVSDFVALSSTCPHLGCQVHWEAQNARFFCPCHNGAFDAGGAAIAGPPAEAGQSLPRFALRVDEGLLYVEVPVETLSEAVALERDTSPAPPGPGHDPCLRPPLDPRCSPGGDRIA